MSWRRRCRPTGRRWSSSCRHANSRQPTFRATISTVFALSNVGGLALFIAPGKITRDGIVAAAVTIPAMLFGQLLGFPIRKHVHGERFRWLVLLLLMAVGYQRHRQRDRLTEELTRDHRSHRNRDRGHRELVLAGASRTTASS